MAILLQLFMMFPYVFLLVVLPVNYNYSMYIPLIVAHTE